MVNNRLMNEILLHCCCAPCSSAIIEWMLNNDVRPTLFYCNPNIFPEEEYIIRKNECTRYAEGLGLRIIDGDYDHEAWRCAVHGLEGEPERGGRCLECFRMRLLAAARKTAELGMDTFTTTLASSRWKRLDQINEAGRWAAEQVNRELGNSGNPEIRKAVTFDDRNWRKGGLQERRNQLLKENGFYNQVYCGCEFSLAAREPMMGKDELRAWIKGLKAGRGLRTKIADGLSDEARAWRKEISGKICRRVMQNGHWRSAGTVLLYHALADEVDTTLLLECALREGKRVLLPKVCGDDLTLHWYNGPRNVAPGAFGILEPVTPAVDLKPLRVDLAVVPGVAFDGCGHRLGRGRGYYDRLLPRLECCCKVGVCFPFQRLEHVPGEEHDMLMDEIITL